MSIAQSPFSRASSAGTAAAVDLDQPTPASMDATAQARQVVYWDLCQARDVGANLITDPLPMMTWIDTANSAVEQLADGSWDWERSTTSRSEDRASGAFPHFTVPTRGRSWRVVMRYEHTNSEPYTLWMVAQRNGASTLHGMMDYRDGSDRKLELWSTSGGLHNVVAYANADTAVWVRVELEAGTMALWYSRATEQPELHNLTTVAADGWVAVGSVSGLPMTGLPRLVIGTFDTSAFGHNVVMHACKIWMW